MQDTIARYLSVVGSGTERRYLREMISAIGDRYSSQALNTATIAIKAGGSALAKNTAVFHGVVQGKPVTVAVNTDMPDLTGLDIRAGKYNVYCFFIDTASALTVKMGTEAAAIGNVKFPEFPEGKALVGVLLVTYASAFTGGTTPLDTATTVYLSPTGAVDPNVVL